MSLGGEKQYLPSEAKLAALRRNGIIPNSKIVLIFACFIGIGCGIAVFIWPQISLITSMTKELLQFKVTSLSSESIDTLFGVIGSNFRFIFILTIKIVFFAVLVVFLVGLLQTKFLVSLSLTTFIASRVLPSLSRVSLFRYFLVFWARLLCVCSISWCLWLMCIATFEFVEERWDDLSILSHRNNLVANGAYKFASSDCRESINLSQCLNSYNSNWITLLQSRVVVSSLSVLGVLTLFGVFARVFVVLLFKKEHSMTRAEMEMEWREEQGSEASSRGDEG